MRVSIMAVCKLYLTLSWVQVDNETTAYRPQLKQIRLNGIQMHNQRFHPNKTLSHFTTLIAAMLVTLLNFSVVQAATMNIKAEFKPDPSNPLINKFVNKTPSTGFCALYPNLCKPDDLFSLRTQIYFVNNATIKANHTDPRQGAIFIVPTEWRDLVITNNQSGEQETVQIRIKGFGSQYRVSPDNIISLVSSGGPSADIYVAHSRLWTVDWSTAPNNCEGTNSTPSSNSTDYTFFWLTSSQGSCEKQAKFDIPNFRYNYLDFAYELRTPNPLTMSTGNYTGVITYTIGPEKDFDMGDVMIPSDDSLTLNFSLDVQHDLKVDIPPGGDKVELIPKGGWQQWLQKGRIPEKLSRDQTFLMSSSSRFKMQLACDRQIGDTCAISNGSHEVPVDVLVSMPNGIANDDNSAVSRKPLSVSTDLLFQPTFYVEQKPSTLHFEIQKQYVEEMLTAQGKYSGNITIVWDSDI